MDLLYYLGKTRKLNLGLIQLKILQWHIPTWVILTNSIYLLCSSGFFPVAINFLRRIPVIGSLLNLPVISTVSEFEIL